MREEAWVCRKVALDRRCNALRTIRYSSLVEVIWHSTRYFSSQQCAEVTDWLYTDGTANSTHHNPIGQNFVTSTNSKVRLEGAMNVMGTTNSTAFALSPMAGRRRKMPPQDRNEPLVGKEQSAKFNIRHANLNLLSLQSPAVGEYTLRVRHTSATYGKQALQSPHPEPWWAVRRNYRTTK
jgi:hypothetical protein